MNRLLEIGFQPAGHWLLKEGELTFELLRHASQRNILYAFVSDGEVKYIGKTTQTLYARMGGYKNPAPSQTTNVRNNARIKLLLQAGQAVDILALPDNGLLHYGQFHLNLAAGLEDSLISVIAPPWNGGKTPGLAFGSPDLGSGMQPSRVVVPDPRAVEAVPEEAASGVESHALPQPTVTFPLVVQKTYYKQGFFNVSVAFEKVFGGDGQEIEIFCGDAEQPIVGTINRTANTNHTPRIMGGKGLRDWFRRAMQELQEASVAVLSPNAIRITPR
jgi:hypothetical protein